MAKLLHPNGASKRVTHSVRVWLAMRRQARRRRDRAAAVLPAPVALEAEFPTPSGFTAHWEAVEGATGYHLDVAANAGFSTFVEGWEDADVGNVVRCGVASLAHGTTYYYRVRAVNENGASASSNVIAATTAAPVLGAPSNFTGYATNADVSFNWDLTGVDNPDGCDLEYRVSGALDWTHVGHFSSGGEVSGYIMMPVSGLIEFRLRAFKGELVSAWTDTLYVAMPPDQPWFDGDPEVRTGAIVVRWTYNGAVPDGFRLVRTSSYDPDPVVRMLGPEDRSYEDGMVAAGQEYSYQVIAYNSLTENYSDMVTVTAQ